MNILEYLDELILDYSQACRRLRSGEVYYIPVGKQCRVGVPASKKSKSSDGGSKASRKKPRPTRLKRKRSQKKAKRKSGFEPLNRHLPRVYTPENILNEVPDVIKRKNKKLSEKMIKEKEKEIDRLRRNFYRYMEAHREEIIEKAQNNQNGK